jgi:hypothetical protein
MPDELVHLTPILVDSLMDEEQHLGSCPCGGGWTVALEDVVPVAGRWFDSLVVACRGCGNHRRAIFEVTKFFTPPTWAWSR